MSRAANRAYSLIRDRILSGELPAGAQLGEEALADLCGVSRTPVRDALRRLESELLVKRSDSQRCFVSAWSIDDVADAFELRAMLEGHAAGRAAERMTPAALQHLRATNAAIREAISAEPADIGSFLEHNRAFHGLILETAQSPRLTALLATLIEQPVVWRTAHHYGREALRRSHVEHEELLAAFARRDAAWAEAVMVAHIRRATAARPSRARPATGRGGFHGWQ